MRSSAYTLYSIILYKLRARYREWFQVKLHWAWLTAASGYPNILGYPSVLANYSEIKPYPKPRSFNLDKRHNEQDVPKLAETGHRIISRKVRDRLLLERMPMVRDDSLMKKYKVSFGIKKETFQRKLNNDILFFLLKIWNKFLIQDCYKDTVAVHI